MPGECCVPGCKKVGGHTFPFSDSSRVRAWEAAIRRDKWKPTKYSVVCYDHFDEDDYLQGTTYGEIAFVCYHLTKHWSI